MYNYWCSPVGINSGAAGNTVFTPNVNFYRETAAPITSSVFGYIGGYNGTTTQIAKLLDIYFSRCHSSSGK